MSKTTRPRKRTLYILFDTSVVYTGSAHHLVRKEISDLIEKHRNIPDLEIRWHIPAIVRHERQFQMTTAATAMLQTLERLENLLDHKLAITPSFLAERVQDAIAKEIERLGLIVLDVDTNRVDWPRMMLDAVYRRAPFQAGEKEKGFRDALVMEAFAQLIEASPTTPEAARILLVTGDQLLREAVHARARDAKNVAVFGSLDELGNLINTLGATVDEDHLKVVREKAAALFYKHDGKSTLYYKANLVTKMQDAVAKFIQLPAGAESYRIDNWHLGLTGFLRKEHQVYTWSTRLEAHLTATKAVIPKVGAYYPLSLGDVSKGSLLAPALESFDFPLVSGVVYPSGTLPYSPPWVASEEAVTTGIASVDVVWTATITADGQLRKPTFLSVVPVDTVWK